MSSGEVRKVSRQDIQLVQNLIERCLQLYMNQKEVMNTLLIQAKIEPSFTELVWQKLEEENQEFFKAYHVRLVVKNQIMIFNQLLEKQAQLMREVQPSGVGSVSLTNGSNTSLQQPPLGFPPGPRADQSHCSIIPSNVINSGLSSHQGIQVANGSSMSAERINMSTGILPVQNQNEQMDLLQGMNGTAIKPEPGFSNNTEFPFCPDGNFLEERTTIVDPPGSSFGCTELIDPTITEPLMGTADPNSYGFLSQIHRNFSFSDLTDHDILETYSRSPFLDPETNGFSASPVEEHESENKRLDTISEGYDGFTSD